MSIIKMSILNHFGKVRTQYKNYESKILKFVQIKIIKFYL